MPEQNENLDAAKIDRMYVTNVTFQWVAGGTSYDYDLKKNVRHDGHWSISAALSDDPSQYHNNAKQTMTFKVETGIGQKLVEVLLPVILADAARKQEQLAKESAAMLKSFGERTMACITAGENNNKAD